MQKIIMLIQPKLICLDTATWGNLARDINTNSLAQRIIQLIQTDYVIPYITWNHISELMHHGNDAVVERRIDLLRSLKFVAYPRQREDHANVGSAVDLRDAELSALLESPDATHTEIIDMVRPLMINGFLKGIDFCKENEEWWNYYRNQFGEVTLRNQTEIAALTHFPPIDDDEPVPEIGKYKLCSSQQAAQYFGSLAKKLELRLSRDVKKPLPDANRIAQGIMNEAYQDGMADYDMQKEGIDWLLGMYDVKRERLPSKPTIGDVGDEAVFIKQLSVHERRLKLPPGSLRQALQKEMLPSWTVWQKLDRAIRRLPKAESGNVNDKMIATFGLYVDYIQLDKRIRNCVIQIARRSELFAGIQSKLITTGDYSSLILELERINAA